MPISLSRRAALLLPLLLAACGGEAPAPVSYTPLDYSYLPPLQLNVARVEVEQHFIPSDQPPSVNQYDPVSPTAALRRMAVERLKPFGSAGRAVFVIENASLVQGGDTITGTFTVRLEIYTSAGTRAAFAEATVSRQVVGEVHNLSETLYLLTRQLMDRMNVELDNEIPPFARRLAGGPGGAGGAGAGGAADGARRECAGIHGAGIPGLPGRAAAVPATAVRVAAPVSGATVPDAAPPGAGRSGGRAAGAVTPATGGRRSGAGRISHALVLVEPGRSPDFPCSADSWHGAAWCSGPRRT